jgi:hypothetical protein
MDAVTFARCGNGCPVCVQQRPDPIQNCLAL